MPKGRNEPRIFEDANRTVQCCGCNTSPECVLLTTVDIQYQAACRRGTLARARAITFYELYANERRQVARVPGFGGVFKST